jgi:energy-coupling factor transport system ATP-binding protein
MSLSIALLDGPGAPAYDLRAMIEIDGITYSYPSSPPALDGVTLTLGEGQRIAVVGANGSGKTTLARCLNGLLIPQSGTVRVDGLETGDAAALAALRQRIGMVFQNPDDQLVATSVETEIAFGMENIGVARDAMCDRVNAALREFDLEPFRKHPPHQLSGGQKQRVAIAAAMVLRPSYLILDEPTALLDPSGRARVMDLVHSLPERFGTTLVHITQSADEAARAERIIVMHQGRVHNDTTPRVLYAEPESMQRLGLDVPFPAALRHALRRRGLGLAPPPEGTSDWEWLRSSLRQCTITWPKRDPVASDSGTRPKISAHELDHVYDRGLPTQQNALINVDLAVHAGSITALLGPSGSGKTTLAQHFNALLTPSRGRVLLDGADIFLQDLPSVRQRVGLVFQFPELQLFAETLEADVAYGPQNLRWPQARIDAAVTAALQLVDLPRDQFGSRPPLALSGGQRRRAALAGILAMEPQVLVLDEPTAGLDSRAAAGMVAVFRDLARQGRTVILITHDMDLVADLTDHVVVLDAGRVALHGSTRNVLTAQEFGAIGGMEAPTALGFARSIGDEVGPQGLDVLTLEDLATCFVAGQVAPAPPLSTQAEEKDGTVSL